MGSLASHVLIFPFMAEGHTLPLIDLSKVLSRRQIKVSILTTPRNAKHLSKFIVGYSNIHLIEVPFPITDGLPEGCENTSHLPSMEFYNLFLSATRQLQKPFEQLLKRLSEARDLPICCISDFFFGWTLDSCQEYNIPRIVFHGMGVLSMAICKSVWVHEPQLKSSSFSDPLDLPNVKLPFTLTAADLPVPANVPVKEDDHFNKLIAEVAGAEVNSWGIIVNSFVELEGNYVSSLESFYNNGAKAWCLGPLFLYNQLEEKEQDFNTSAITTWLNKQEKSSVTYVAFGTQADVSDTQLNEAAFGLEASQVPFILVVRSHTWAPPEGMQERLSNKGLIIQEFINQRKILAHEAIGGFLSHCGWNSVLESISACKPILAWPMLPFSEQGLNAKFVIDGIKAGIALKRNVDNDGSVEVTRGAICEGVKELMSGGKGKMAREKMEELGSVAKNAVREGGSSSEALMEMMDRLCA